MRIDRKLTTFLLCFLPLGGTALAGRLRVEPILLEVSAPAASATITLHSEAADALVQTRVVRWRQVNGQESLEPTEDVVASPPMVKMGADTDYLVRVVRVSRQPIQGEESYRILVDQVPDQRQRQARSINILVRQSIPVFFRGAALTPPQVAWTIARQGGHVALNLTNTGDERLRLASIRLNDRSGRSVSLGDGLIGYVLGRSTMRWILPASARALSGPIAISAKTDKGPLHAVAP